MDDWIQNVHIFEMAYNALNNEHEAIGYLVQACLRFTQFYSILMFKALDQLYFST